VQGQARTIGASGPTRLTFKSFRGMKETAAVDVVNSWGFSGAAEREPTGTVNWLAANVGIVVGQSTWSTHTFEPAPCQESESGVTVPADPAHPAIGLLRHPRSDLNGHRGRGHRTGATSHWHPAEHHTRKSRNGRHLWAWAARSGTRNRSASPWPPPHNAAAPMPPPRRASANARCMVTFAGSAGGILGIVAAALAWFLCLAGVAASTFGKPILPNPPLFRR